MLQGGVKTKQKLARLSRLPSGFLPSPSANTNVLPLSSFPSFLAPATHMFSIFLQRSAQLTDNARHSASVKAFSFSQLRTNTSHFSRKSFACSILQTGSRGIPPPQLLQQLKRRLKICRPGCITSVPSVVCNFARCPYGSRAAKAYDLDSVSLL